HDGSGGERGLATAAGALIGPGLGFQPPGFATTASRADKPVGPARRCKVLSAGSLIAEALLELDQGAGKVGHRGSREQLRVRDLFLTQTRPRGYNILCPRTQRDKASRGLKLAKPNQDFATADEYMWPSRRYSHQ